VSHESPPRITPGGVREHTATGKFRGPCAGPRSRGAQPSGRLRFRRSTGLGRPEAGGGRLLLAHVRALLGRSVSLGAGGVINLGSRIDPHHGIERTAALGGAFARVLSLPPLG